MPEWYDKLLELQLRKNLGIWAELERQGIAEDSELRLGFIYIAPGEEEARSLVEFLRQETDYDVDVRAPQDADGDGTDWFVIGTTQATRVTRERLDDWVEWMIAAGAAEGPCAFDGWAAQLVSE